MASLDMMDLLKIYFAFKYRPPTNIKKTKTSALDFHWKTFTSLCGHTFIILKVFWTWKNCLDASDQQLSLRSYLCYLVWKQNFSAGMQLLGYFRESIVFGKFKLVLLYITHLDSCLGA